MGMTVDEIMTNLALAQAVRRQAEVMAQVHATAPRVASVFATQQRWLMAHVGAAHYFRNMTSGEGQGLPLQTFLELVFQHGLASRNTASAFFNEMLKYGTLRYIAGTEGRRSRPAEPGPAALESLRLWHALHLSTLDALDGGQRAAIFMSDPHVMMAHIQPLISAGLLSAAVVREPTPTFSLFTWVNEGGILMDRLFAGLDLASATATRIPVDVTSVSSLAAGLSLSRPHTGRVLSAAEKMGSLGWTGTRGHSRLWVAPQFQQEYHIAQATKLAIIDAAFEVGCREMGVPARFANTSAA